MKEYIGFHGTDALNEASICTSGFRASSNPDDWLGTGVYFFIDGIKKGLVAAKEWAIAESWNNHKRNYDYAEYIVLEVIIRGDKVLDLTLRDHLTNFNLVRSMVLSLFQDKFVTSKGFDSTHDTLLMNLAMDYMKLDIVISDMYVKNAKLRKERISSRIPNVTMMCIKNANLIDRESIKAVQRGLTNED